MRTLIPSCCLAVALAAGGCAAQGPSTTGRGPAAGASTASAIAPAAASASVAPTTASVPVAPRTTSAPVAPRTTSAPVPPPPVFLTRSAPPRAFYHQSNPYRLQNSVRGLREAVAAGLKWTDVDSNYCWDDAGTTRIPLAVHWSHIRGDRFRDPLLQVPDDSRWADLALTTARRLRTDDPQPYRVLTMIEMVRAAARYGLVGIEWEVKDGVGFESSAMYRPVLRVAAAVGVKVVVKTLRNLGGDAAALRRLWAAKKAGATTMLLNHDTTPVRITAARGTYVNYVRGPWTDVR